MHYILGLYEYIILKQLCIHKYIIIYACLYYMLIYYIILFKYKFIYDIT